MNHSETIQSAARESFDAASILPMSKVVLCRSFLFTAASPCSDYTHFDLYNITLSCYNAYENRIFGNLQVSARAARMKRERSESLRQDRCCEAELHAICHWPLPGRLHAAMKLSQKTCL